MNADAGSVLFVPEWVVSAVPGRALQVYCVLLAHSDGAGVCRIEQQAIAARLHCSLRTVSRSLRELEHAGAIGVKPQYHSDGGRHANAYMLLRRARTEATA